MTSVNTPEEQAIAFLLTCVENSQKGKVRNTWFQARSLTMSTNYDVSLPNTPANLTGYVLQINWDNVSLDIGVNMTPEAA